MNSYTYTPFGELLTGEGSGFRFNGEYYDSATGMVNLRARQYEPSVMRFGQRDIWHGKVEMPTSQNRYLYCVNEPIGYYDRSGNRVDEDAGRPRKVKPETTSGQTGVINFKTAAQQQIEKLVRDKAAAAKKTPLTVASGILSNATNAMSYIEKKWPMHEATVKYVQQQNRGSVINRNETKLPGCGRKGGTGYPDVTQFPTVPDVVKGSQVWEVKPDTPYGWRTGKIQMENYTKSGLVPGRAIYGAIPYSDGKLVIRSGSALSGDEGVVYYAFIKDPQTESVVVGEPERATQTEQVPIPTSERTLNNAKIFVNGLAVAILIADDSTVVGIIDDVLIPLLTVEIIKLTNAVAPTY